MHHADAQCDGVARADDARGLAVDDNLPGVRMDQAVEDVHQRRLAGAVLADKGVDLARAHRQVDVVVGDHPRPRLRDPAQLKRKLFRVPRAHSFSGAYGMPSAAGGMLPPTTPARPPTLRMQDRMPTRY